MKKMAVGHHIGMYMQLFCSNPHDKSWPVAFTVTNSLHCQGVSVCLFVGERSHTVERRENVRTKDREQHQHLVNLEESKRPSNQQLFIVRFPLHR